MTAGPPGSIGPASTALAEPIDPGCGFLAVDVVMPEAAVWPLPPLAIWGTRVTVMISSYLLSAPVAESMAQPTAPPISRLPNVVLSTSDVRVAVARW
ncbi:MAG: hypothetical protein HOH66_12355 [Rhodospirillaceae bacterium]|nr:hypothetical protein [Rhodospirillaceae bacterium]MBT6118649.1 hypothetical protein [Rhodospirillaceae bacterium]